MNPDVHRAAQILRAGGLVAFPTETVYGLGADASSAAAVARLYAAKDRPADHPVIIHFHSPEEAFAWGREIPDQARKLAARFWPGPLTLILKRSARAQDFVTGGQDSVGLRVPSHPVARQLLHEFGDGVSAAPRVSGVRSPEDHRGPSSARRRAPSPVMMSAIRASGGGMHRKFWFLVSLAAALACPLPAPAQKYPDKPIRLVVAFPTGSPYILALLLSEKLRDLLGQPVVPDFRGGAGGNLAAEIVAKAPADGYTLLLTSATIVISPSLFPKLGYDTFRDFTPVTLLATVPNVLVVHPSVPARSLGELVKLAKAHPGKLNYGSGGVGSGSQLGSELFRTLNGISMVHVPYKGAALALSAMLGGEVDLVTSTVPAAIPLVANGRVRALAVMAPARVAALPNVPTTAEAGMPELVVITWYGLFAPAGVKPDIIERLNSEFVSAMNAPDTRGKLAKVELDVATSTPAETARFVRAEFERWARVIREAGIKPAQ